MPELRHRERHLFQIALFRVAINAHDTFGLGEWQTAQKEILDQTEDGSVHPDAECEREHPEKSKSGRFAELAKGESKVVHIIRCVVLELHQRARREPPAASRRSPRPLVTQALTPLPQKR